MGLSDTPIQLFHTPVLRSKGSKSEKDGSSREVRRICKSAVRPPPRLNLFDVNGRGYPFESRLLHDHELFHHIKFVLLGPGQVFHGIGQRRTAFVIERHGAFHDIRVIVCVNDFDPMRL
jgi:hypothetical protein